jgi:hypothetical protein
MNKFEIVLLMILAAIVAYWVLCAIAGVVDGVRRARRDR